MPTDLNLHCNVRQAYRQAMEQRRTQREAFHSALDLVLEGKPHADPVSTGRAVALMLANEPGLLGGARKARERQGPQPRREVAKRRP
jgi:hypothetical protein